MKRTNRRGKILRLKVGYNPNSSSIGSVVYLFSSKLLLLTASFGVVSGLILSFFIKKKPSLRAGLKPAPTDESGKK